MGRKAKLGQVEQDFIRAEYARGVKVTVIAKENALSIMLVYRVINKKGAYADRIEGTPVLDAHANVVGIIPQDDPVPQV